MSNLVKLEETGLLLLSVVLFSKLNYAWWVYPACILLPDLSMVGYLANTRTGALIYNFFHHKLLAVALIASGFTLNISVISLAGIILFGHSSMDRIFGYGLKFSDSFKNTHLGLIK